LLHAREERGIGLRPLNLNLDLILNLNLLTIPCSTAPPQAFMNRNQPVRF
jgi:hypothetical protein